MATQTVRSLVRSVRASRPAVLPPAELREAKPAGSDCLAAATLFAILGGVIGLLLADWSVLTGVMAAAISAAVGVLFAES